MFKVYQMLCAIWYHLHNLKNVKNTHGGMSILVKLQPCFTKSNTLHGYFSRSLNCANRETHPMQINRK